MFLCIFLTENNFKSDKEIRGKYNKQDNTLQQISKVAVNGWNLKGNVMLKVRVGGELVAPQLAEVKNEEFLVTFLLKDTVSPDGLQLEFTGDEAMQVFELEVF